ncbi:alpha/beta hydrolase [Chengkuizengella sediminis]|uniref:alpha/beta hydrolase n=1 Tax=Chengkuizengella sediminis TaxID=1885917 RepID=UPI00138A000A|nr:alpha/beta fold hydrolase [Chengkuizengella sediminis]NDI33553.1 alpha/beta fold hydrolase [Chengkuizengella sediminis]
MIIAISIVIFIGLGCFSIAMYVGWNLSHPQKQSILDSPMRYDLKYTDVEFKSRDQVTKLKGWFIPNHSTEPAKMTIIFVHGYTKNREQDNFPFLSLAQSIVKAGYNVLLFDLRNSGESSGGLTTLGQLEKYDVLGAIDWIQQNKEGKVGLLGVSMGAATAIQAAAEEPSVAGLIADSPYHDLKYYLRTNLATWSNLPNSIFTPLIMNILGPLIGIKPEEVSPIKSVDAIYPRPILFIHSEGDQSISYTESERMFNKHPDQFEFWKTKCEVHVRSFQQYPVEYTNKVISFFNKISC